MPRRRACCRIHFSPIVRYFKPQGVPLRELEEVILAPSEMEALKLHDVDGLEQVVAAEKMGISQPTFGRILNAAYKKIAHALVQGKAIKIEQSHDNEK